MCILLTLHELLLPKLFVFWIFLCNLLATLYHLSLFWVYRLSKTRMKQCGYKCMKYNVFRSLAIPQNTESWAVSMLTYIAYLANNMSGHAHAMRYIYSKVVFNSLKFLLWSHLFENQHMKTTNGTLQDLHAFMFCSASDLWLLCVTVGFHTASLVL